MIGIRRFIPAYLLIAATGFYINLHSDITVPMNRSLAEFPLVLKSWKMASQSEFSEQVLDVLKPTDYLVRGYRGEDGRVVNLYIGYHGGGKGGGEIHSPKHCLPGSGWFKVSHDRTQLEAGGKKINVVRAVYQKGDQREVFYYWFQVRDREISDEYSLKLAEITNSMLHRRRDAAFVRISVPLDGNGKEGVASAERFIRDFYPAIRGFLPS